MNQHDTNFISTKLSERDLGRYYTLSTDDKKQIFYCRGNINRLGYALQICHLRMTGRFINDFSSYPLEAINYIAGQLDLPAVLIFDYPQRARTQWEHEESICQHFGYQRYSPETELMLKNTLSAEAVQSDKSDLLLELACRFLRQNKIILPAFSTLERLIGSVRQETEQLVDDFFVSRLTDKQKQELEKLLLIPEGAVKSPLHFLKDPPARASPEAILRQLNKIDFIRTLGIHQLDLSGINPNKLRYLALVTKHHSTTTLQRFNERKRLSLITAFLYELLTESIDSVIEMHDMIMTGINRRATREVDENFQVAARSINEKLILLQELCQLILDNETAETDLQILIKQHFSAEQLQQITQECELLIRPVDNNCFKQMTERYAYVRRYSPRLLQTIEFRPTRENAPLLQAIEYLKQCNQTHQKKLINPPVEFVPKKWRPYVITENTVDRRVYELCLLDELKNTIRAADFWVKGSRAFADFKSYLLPDKQWTENRQQYYRQLNLPINPEEFIQQLQGRFQQIARRVDDNWTKNECAQLEKGRLHLARLEAQIIPPTVNALKEEIATALPKMTLPQLLIEVNRLTSFTQAFTHLTEKQTKNKEWLQHLFASLIAQGCNIGLWNMAEATAGISYRQLAYLSDWYIREETLKKANVTLINFHHRLPLAMVWGDGTASVSDGQRFTMPVDSLMAEFHPRYFKHYDRGVVVYTHQSDQFAQFYTRVIHCSPREAPFVLDGLEDHETDLHPHEHFTDTHGYTENVFALCYLLGFRFSPRIRDLADQNIYKTDKDISYSNIDPLFAGNINWKLIREQWDEIVRLVASVKNRVVKPSLLLRKMGDYSRKSQLMKAIQEIGRVEKSIFILDYIDDPALRRRVQIHINRNESKHALSRYLCFGSGGEIRLRDYDEQLNRMTSLSLLINAILVWNTVQIDKLIQQWQGQGKIINKEDLAHISPLMFAHINPYGEYHFDITEADVL